MQDEDVTIGAGDSLPDFDSMSDEEISEWFLADPPPVPLASFLLQTADGRREFLREYVRRGEEAVFEAVSHIWSQLSEPKGERCTAMGIAAGTGGTGKVALMNLLSRVLTTVLGINPRLPKAEDFGSLEEWHRAVIESLDSEEREANRVYEEFSDILNGGPKRPPHKHLASGQVLAGPWLTKGPRK